MNFRDSGNPPDNRVGTEIDLTDVTGKTVDFEITSYYDLGDQRRVMKGTTVVKDGGDLDIPGLLIGALTEMRDAAHFPDGVVRMEIHITRRP